MEIILIRHAKAEEKREDLEDIKRNLTEKGKKKFQKLMPKLKEKLEPIEDRNIILWSSPATRALETAHIIAHDLQIKISSIHDFIYEGDFQKMSREIQDVDAETTLLIVGHEPSLSEWTKELAGEDVKIKKGAMLNFNVTNQSPLEAELQWTIAPK